MKRITTKITLLTALVFAGIFSAKAQSNNPPDDADYSKFASFITDRNIFDPNRYPHNQRTSTYHRPTRTHTRSSGPQGVTLVGTMAYEKGYFAFFNAGDSDFKKIISVGGEIADYTVKSICSTNVTLVGKDKKEVAMQIGDQMQQVGGTWKVNGDTGSATANDAVPETTATTDTDNSNPTTDATDTKPAASPSNLDSNPALKRLMELRAKENQ